MSGELRLGQPSWIAIGVFAAALAGVGAFLIAGGGVFVYAAFASEPGRPIVAPILAGLFVGAIGLVPLRAVVAILSHGRTASRLASVFAGGRASIDRASVRPGERVAVEVSVSFREPFVIEGVSAVLTTPGFIDGLEVPVVEVELARERRVLAGETVLQKLITVPNEVELGEADVLASVRLSRSVSVETSLRLEVLPRDSA